MPTDDLTRLRNYLVTLPAGRIENPKPVIALLAACWDDIIGSDVEATTSDKLYRMEDLEWHPPMLSFTLERHGATVGGSTRAELHDWEVDVEKGNAFCESSHRYRQLYDRDSPLHVEPLVTEIVEMILAGKDDPKLKWLRERLNVRVLVGTFISGRYKQTEQGRRRRFRQALEFKLKAEGWEKVLGKLDVYQRASRTGAE